MRRCTSSPIHSTEYADRRVVHLMTQEEVQAMLDIVISSLQQQEVYSILLFDARLHCHVPTCLGKSLQHGTQLAIFTFSCHNDACNVQHKVCASSWVDGVFADALLAYNALDGLRVTFQGSIPESMQLLHVARVVWCGTAMTQAEVGDPLNPQILERGIAAGAFVQYTGTAAA